MKLRLLIVIVSILLFLLNTFIVNGALIQGTVYNYELERVDAIVTIDTQPSQRIVAVNGTFEFNIDPGNFTLNATLFSNEEKIEFATEDIEIIEEGIFTIDLILFPSFDINQENDLIDVENQDFTFSENEEWWTFSRKIVLGIVIVILAFIFFTQSRSITRKKELEKKDRKQTFVDEKIESSDESIENEMTEVIEFIKLEKRVLQKDLYKKFSYSEAKISLLLSDLEDQGKVKKIKKGRKNIIVWK